MSVHPFNLYGFTDVLFAVQPLHGSPINYSEFPMQGSSIVLVFAPLAILLVLMPAFEASSFPAIIKGSFIGLYIAISIIGILKMFEELRS